MNTGREVLLVAAGGAIGAPLRVGISRIAPTVAPQFPWSTLAINLAGALVLGILAGRWYEGHGDEPWVRPFVGAGVIGGFTTFSTFSVETVDLIRTHHSASAILYVGISVVLGLTLATIGLRIGGYRAGRDHPGSGRQASRA